MNLLQVCEPVFLYVCRLNRMARKGGSLDYAVVRNEIKGLLADARAAAGAQPDLVAQYEKIEMPLIFFVDSLLVESGLPFAQQWHQERLAYERHELAGDEKFFDFLDETLADSTDAAVERLAVFYVAIGLGFTGWYAGRPQDLQRKMKEIAARIRRHTETDPDARICPEAYQHVDARNLIEPPSRKLGGIVLALVGLLVVLFATNVFLYRVASRDLSRALRTIVNVQWNGTPADAESRRPER